MSFDSGCREHPPGHPEADAGMQDALFASKVDAFAAEYNHLLVSQLDSQRQYFEGLLRKQEGEGLQTLAEVQAAAEAAKAQLESSRSEARDALHARKNAERKLVRTDIGTPDSEQAENDTTTSQK